MSNLRVNSIVPSLGTNVAIGTAGGTITYNANVTGIATFSSGIVVSAGSTSAPSISPTEDSNTGIFFPSADTIAFGEGGVEAARIDSSGRLLVGTSSARSNVYYTTVSTTPSVQFETAGSSYDGLSLINYSSSGYSPVLTLGLSASNTKGINTAVSASFDLGAINFVGNDGTNFRTGAAIFAVNDQASAWASGDCPGRLVFSTTADNASSPTERMRIGNNGLVTITNGNTTFLELVNTGGYSCFHVVDGTAYTIGQNSNVRSLRIGSGLGFLTTGVSLAAGGTSWGTYSDERLKTDIVELSGCLDSIKDIRCVSYRLTDVDELDSKKRLGVIAQDLVGKYDEAVNASRRSDDDETEYLSVQYADLVPVLIKALQEATQKIETLEARLTALESA